MITFDIECSNGHVFEGWFDSLQEFEKQREKGLVSCPYCNDTNVKRILSPVAIRHSKEEMPQSDNKQADGSVDYARLYREFVDYIKNNSEDVGTDFAKEALKMHYGIVEKRNIRGSATEEEEKILKKEGIEFLKIPMPIDEKEKKH
ncbi:MAG: DUF1178 domain-containing protein [Deltaproteobacteria bacterium]|nr:MAG: DUF1178 domain-containing protein [Deltaproteobacteria bacterium]